MFTGIRGENPYIYTKFKLYLMRIIHNYFTTYTIINNISGINNYVAERFKKNKFVYIPNAINIETIIKKYNLSNYYNVLTVARFDESKDIVTAISAINRVVRFYNFAGIKYFIVGYGKLENNIRTKITNYNIHENIKLIVSPRDARKFYSIANIYLSTSKREGLSNSIMEAMSFGLPLIVTNVGDNKLLVDHFHNGFLVNVGDVNDIANKVVFLIESPHLCEQFGNESLRKIRDFSISNLTERYIDLIEGL